MKNSNEIQVIDSGIDNNLLVEGLQQLSHEIRDVLQISKEDADKVDHFEFSIRFIPEIAVKVYPRR